MTALAASLPGLNDRAETIDAKTPPPNDVVLRLTDIFSSSNPSSAITPGPPRFDSEGPTLVIPDLAAWKVPMETPTPATTAADIPEGIDLPKLPMLITLARPDQRILRRKAFEARGLYPAATTTANTAIRIETQFQQLRSEYKLIPTANDDAKESDEIVLFHGPGTTEQFEIPAGEWRLQRKVWLADHPEKIREEIYADQMLSGGSLYIYTAAQDSEVELEQELQK